MTSTIGSLSEAGREYADAREGAEAARVALVAAIRAAAGAGTPETTIAREAGVSRPTVRKALGKG